MKANQGKGKRKPFTITQRRDMVILPNSLTEAAEESNIRRRLAPKMYKKSYIDELVRNIKMARRSVKENIRDGFGAYIMPPQLFA